MSKNKSTAPDSSVEQSALQNDTIDTASTNRAYERELYEPEELSNPLPKWFAVMSVCFVVWGFGYFYFQGVVPADAGDRRTAIAPPGSGPVDGKVVYAANCVSCHQGTGAGIPGAFPPLAASEWVLTDPQIPAQILLHGMQGPIEVAGQSYSGVMPTMAHLSDDELAAVLSYIRSDWGNSASEVTGEWIAEQRDRFIDRGPWDGAAELIAGLGEPLVDGVVATDVSATERAPTGSAPAAATEDTGPADGKAVYATNCGACHQGTGLGIPGAFPPLASSEWVLTDPQIPAQILLHGMQGPIEVAGQSYSGAMPAMAHLSDDDLAAVLNYIRSEWGNSASEVTGEWIAEQRGRFMDRGAWQGADELVTNFGEPELP